MTMRTIVADGYWCGECEFFEAEKEFDSDDGQCRSCGCPGAAHATAEVVVTQ